MPHLWIRSESRANERRVGLTPDGLRELRIQGFRVTVEDSASRPRMTIPVELTRRGRRSESRSK